MKCSNVYRKYLNKGYIVLKTDEEIKRIRNCCKILAEVLNSVRERVKPGIDTLSLDRFAEQSIIEKDGKPAFKGYRGYQYTLCTSVNEAVVHGVPSARKKLKKGDIISIDAGVHKDGFYGDAAITVPVGEISEEAYRLIEVTKMALSAGIAKAVVGNRLFDISAAIQSVAESHGYSVVKSMVGHGIGRELHEKPEVPNFGEPGKGIKLQEGMTIAIEPMVNLGTHEIEVLDDNWTQVTRDRKLSAHFEHTIAIRTSGTDVLTDGILW